MFDTLALDCIAAINTKALPYPSTRGSLSDYRPSPDCFHWGRSLDHPSMKESLKKDKKLNLKAKNKKTKEGLLALERSSGRVSTAEMKIKYKVKTWSKATLYI